MLSSVLGAVEVNIAIMPTCVHLRRHRCEDPAET